MCAIAGLYAVSGKPIDRRALERMVRIQAHRGPDGQGFVLLSTAPSYPPVTRTESLTGGPDDQVCWERYSLAFGHRRLAILDLSPLGHQPMATDDQRCWVTYNGEIYNYLELREELKKKGYRFRSASDTEVLLAAYSEWGEDCITHFNGMFAFALWDSVRRRLFCARDRLGVKPFYYNWDGEQFTFASEIKALLVAGISAVPNDRVIFDYLEGSYLDYSNDTFFKGIQQLAPGHRLVLEGSRPVITRYWDIPTEDTEYAHSVQETAEEFGGLFRDAVRVRLRTDVPVGTCLSGGLDSSSIVCLVNDLMLHDQRVPRHLIGERQNTFSSCFEDPAYDERRFIQSVLKRTGAHASYTFPDPKELADRWPELVWHQEEPFGSTSVFAQWNVMRLAAQRGVKVLLDGQGADELLAGYHGFFGALFADLITNQRWLTLIRELVSYRRLHGPFPPYVPANLARALLPSSLVRFVRSRVTGSTDWIAPAFRHAWGPVTTCSTECSSHVGAMQMRLVSANGLRALLHFEDRNSMAFGVETRLPFLDYRLVEFMARLPAAFKIRNGWTKAVLRRAMEGYLPEDVRWRTDKMGFVTPEDVWFRTCLREMAHTVLSDQRTRARGYLDVDAALREFETHVAGQKNISFTIWRWLNLELWCRRFVDESHAQSTVHS